MLEDEALLNKFGCKLSERGQFFGIRHVMVRPMIFKHEIQMNVRILNSLGREKR
jgi:hypothetical protein